MNVDSPEGRHAKRDRLKCHGLARGYLLAMAKPGTWMIHCHIAEHLEAGMMIQPRTACRNAKDVGVRKSTVPVSLRPKEAKAGSALSQGWSRFRIYTQLLLRFRFFTVIPAGAGIQKTKRKWMFCLFFVWIPDQVGDDMFGIRLAS